MENTTTTRECCPIVLEPAQQQEFDDFFDKMTRFVRHIYFQNRIFYDSHHAYRRGGTVLKYDGGTSRSGKVYPCYWPTLTRHLVRLSVDPNSFVEGVFDFARRRRMRVPLPPHLCTEWALDVYRHGADNCDERRRKRYEMNTTAINREARFLRDDIGWERTRAMRHAIAFTIQAAPILRYCLASLEGFDSTAACYHDAALMQCVFDHRFLDTVCQIPDALRAEASIIIDRILSQR